MSRPAILLVLALLVAGLPGPTTAESDDDAAWRLLASVRDTLAAQPWELDFVQTFVPAGFSSGESESGLAALELPDCLRWDYTEPFPRTFLVSGDTVYAWNEGERDGRRFDLGEEEARHLELLRLDLESLATRYRASVTEATDGVSAIRLEPLDEGGRIRDAILEIDSTLGHLLSLTYHDDEGNETRFALAGYRPAVQDGDFEPPPGIDWIDSP